MIEGLCSKCHENFMNCKCSQFYPNVNETSCHSCGELIKIGEKVAVYHLECDNLLTVNLEQAKALQDYFIKRAGFISHEFDELVHEFTRKLDRFIEERK